MNKSIVMFGMISGSTIGSYLPVFFGASAFSLSSIFCGFLGGMLGIWFAFRLVN